MAEGGSAGGWDGGSGLFLVFEGAVTAGAGDCFEAGVVRALVCCFCAGCRGRFGCVSGFEAFELPPPPVRRLPLPISALKTGGY